MIYLVRSRLDPHARFPFVAAYATQEEAEACRQKILENYEKDEREYLGKLVDVQPVKLGEPVREGIWGL